MTTLTELRAQFEAGLRDDKCVLVTPQDGLALLAVIEAAKAYRDSPNSATEDEFDYALEKLDKEKT